MERKSLRQRYLLWRNSLHFQISARRKGWRFELVLHESLKPVVSVIKIVLTLVGLSSAFVAFQNVFVSFFFGLLIYAITTAFERAVFTYNSFFVQPLPNFTIEPDKWLGAFFGYAETADRDVQIPIIGWIMSDADYAQKVHNLLLTWSYGRFTDEDKNICASVIVDGDDYVFFCYPSLKRKDVQAFHEEVETERKKTSLTDEHSKMFAMLVFGKRCKITRTSYFPTFRKRYREGVPVLFRLALPRSDGQTEEIPDLKDFVLFTLKIKDRNELTRKDMEFDHFRIRE